MKGLYDSIVENINEYVVAFASKITDKYAIPTDELMVIWKNVSNQSEIKTAPKPQEISAAEPEPAKKKSSPSKDKEAKDVPYDLSMHSLIAYGKTELAAICKAKCLKVSGKKDELLQRIVDCLGLKEEAKTILESGAEKKTKPAERKKSSPKKAEKKEQESNVIKKVNSSISELKIRRNKWGNYEDQTTGLVFREDQKVHGRQLDDGSVVDLTPGDIELCKKYKYSYAIPENLNKGRKPDESKNSAPSDDDEEEYEEEEVEEEEELDE